MNLRSHNALRLAGALVTLGVGGVFGQVRVEHDRLEEVRRTPQDSQTDFKWSAALARNVGQLLETMQTLGPWDEHAAYITHAVENVFETNGWNTEADQFGLDMVREVSAVPPWDPLARLERMSGMLAQRYGLTREQQENLRQLVIRESNEMFQQNMGNIMQYSLEAIQTRAAGEPFTPEQVQRWAKLAQPVMRDAQRRLQRASTEFMEQLTPEQQALVQRDLDLTVQRQSELIGMADGWARGNWAPSDWGLQDDPIQNAAATAGAAKRQASAKSAAAQRTAAEKSRPNKSRAAARATKGRNTATPSSPRTAAKQRSARRTAPPPKDVDAWEKYVRDFIAKYKLNEDQEQTAWRIHNTLKQRGKSVERRYDKQIEALKARNSDDSPQLSKAIERHEKAKKELVDKLFAQLKERLDVLPTRDQRKAAGEDPAADKESAAG